MGLLFLYTLQSVNWGRGARGEYSYICVLPDEFIFKSVVFKFISNEICHAEHKYMNIHPPPQLTI